MTKLGSFAAAIAAVSCAFSASAESTFDYVQDDLVAIWDGFENNGFGGHATALTEWTDTSGKHSFVFKENSGITVDGSSLVFTGDTGCYATMDASGTAATFDLARNGTLEVVFKAASDRATTSFLLRSSGTSGIAAGNYNSQTSWIVSNTPNSSNPVLDGRGEVTTLVVHYANGLASDPYVNGQSAKTSGRDFWSSSQSLTSLGANYDGGRSYKGEIYAIRLYKTKLTAEQIAANRTVDVERFVEGKTDSGNDTLRIVGSPTDIVPVTPAYGETKGLSVGASFTCSAPAVWTNAEKTVTMACGGYTVTTNGIVYLAGSGNSFTYTHPDCESGARLVWTWVPKGASSFSYAQDGLVHQWDGLENAGIGRHDEATNVWIDLKGAFGLKPKDENTRFTGNALTRSTLNYAYAKADTAITGIKTMELTFRRSAWQTYAVLASLEGYVDNGRGILTMKNNGVGSTYHGYHDSYDATHCEFVTVALYADVAKGADNLFVNGVALPATGDSEGWSSNMANEFTLGGRWNNNGVNCFSGDIYACRLYNRHLAPEELVRNAKVDAIRFNGMSGGEALRVTGTPDEYGEVSPAYGEVPDLVAGDRFRCTASKVWTNAAETVTATCVGYKVLVDDAVYKEGTFGETDESAFDYVHPDSVTGVELVWRWATKCRVAPVIDGAGTVEVSGDGWFAAGETATVTAVPADGAVFHHWAGEVADADKFSPTISLTTGETPVALTAVFSSPVYVSKDGSDENGGTSWEDAFATVEKALATGEAPTVIVGEGLYNVQTAIKVTTTATIRGSGERGAVFRLAKDPGEGNDKRAVFYVANELARLENIALTTGGGQRGCGLYLNGGTVENCAITNCATVNLTMNGGGIYMAMGTIRNCLVDNNICNSSGGGTKHGGGIYMTGGLVEGCTFTRNQATYGGSSCGGGVWASGGTVRNCLIANSAAAAGPTAVSLSDTALMENCTVVGSTHGGASTAAFRATGGAKVRNTIIRRNTNATGELNIHPDSVAAAFENCCSTPECGGSGMVYNEPVFVAPDAGDWRLQFCDCVDAGLDADWMAGAKDLAGEDRIVGKHVDIGCYEYRSDGLACSFSVASDGALDTATLTLTGTVAGADPEDVTFTWTLTDSAGNETVRDGKGLSTLELQMPADIYSVTLAVSDGAHEASASRADAATVFAKDIYVSPEGANVLPYADFANASTNLVEAILLATDGSTLHLSDGVHWLSDRLVVSAGIRIVHAGDPLDAVVTGGRGGTCLVMVNHANAVLSGLDICGSYPVKYVPDGKVPSKNISNGVRIGSSGGTVTNCVVESCYCPYEGGDSGSGGGVNIANGLVVDSVIRNNYMGSSGGAGSLGGGVYLSGGLVDRCVITNNHATGGTACRGGGAYVDGGTLRNSLVAYCKTVTGGGIYRNGGTVQNCTVVKSEGTTAAGGISGTTVDCLVFDNVANGVPVDQDDPGFKDAANGNFRLAAGSAAIDASVTEGIGDLDLDGNDRYQGLEARIADKGCYEYDPTVFELGIGYERLADFFPADVRFTASAGGPSLDEGKSWWTFDGREPTADDCDATGSVVTRTMGPGEYTVRFKTVYNEKVYEITKEKWFVLYGETVYVNPNNPAPALPYAGWETAATNINDALKCLVAGSTLVVSDGVYRVSPEQNLNRQVTIRSLNGPTVTKFTGSRPFHLNSAKATIAGFAFEKFNSWQQGGAMRLSNGTVSNCVFASCVIQTGGGAAVLMSAGTVVDCVVTNCSTTYAKGQLGAAINADGANALIDRCIVTGSYWQGANTNNAAVALQGGAKMRNSVVANNRGGATGGVVLTGASRMENCTVTGNTAYYATGVGGVGAADTASVVNTIIWNNANVTTGAASEKSGADAVYDTCCTEDPKFRRGRAEWLLKNDSPCRDTAKELDWMDGALDVFGQPRVRYGKPDIGAAESPYEPGMMLIVR